MAEINSDVASVIAAFMPLESVLHARMVCRHFAAVFVNPPTRITVSADHTMTISRHTTTLMISAGTIVVNGVICYITAPGPVYCVGRFAGVHVVLVESYQFYGLEYHLKRLVGAAYREFPMLRSRRLSYRNNTPAFDNFEYPPECHTNIKDICGVWFGANVAIVDEKRADEMIDAGFVVYAPPYGVYFFVAISRQK